MNLRKKAQQAGSDNENESKMDEVVPADRLNRRIATAAKHLINFINDVNKESREAKKKRERKQEVEIEKPEVVKKPKVQKQTNNVVHPPKPIVQKPPQKHETNRDQQKTNKSQHYKFIPGNPLGLPGIDGNKFNMPNNMNFEYMLQQQMKHGFPYFSGLQYLTLQNPYGGLNIPIQNMQNFSAMLPQNMQALQGMAGMQGMTGIPGMPGMMQNNGNKPPYFYGVPMMPPQMPAVPQNLNQFKNIKHEGKDNKIFNRASYHVAIAYNIHIQKLKKKSQAQQMDQSSLDPTHWARKMRDQNRDDRQIVRQIQPINNQIRKQ